MVHSSVAPDVRGSRPGQDDRADRGEATCQKSPGRNAETDRNPRRSTVRRACDSPREGRGGGSVPPAAVSFGSAELRVCHFVTGEIQDPAIGGEQLLGASAQLRSEGTQMKTGSASHELQMPLAKKTSSLKSGPALPNGSEGGLVVYVHDDAAPQEELLEGPEAQDDDDATDLEGVDLGGSVREG